MFDGFFKKPLRLKMDHQKLTKVIRGLTDIKINMTIPALTVAIIIVIIILLLR